MTTTSATSPALTHATSRPTDRLAELHDIVSSYRTCEFATVNRAGLPFAWPAVCEIAPDGTAIVLTTCIGFPRKALNVRRDPRVALLFSDPTGTGRTDLPQVLVQGTAVCPEEIHTSPAGLESYWRQLWERQPSSKGYASTALGRKMFAFYYYRLVITVAPETVTVGAPLPPRQPQQADRAATRGSSAFAATARRLPEFGDAVLAFVPDGEVSALPELRRVRVTADARDDRLLLESADGRPLPAFAADRTAATLLLHSHDDKLARQRQLNVVGELTGGALRPERVVNAGEAVGPLATLRILRRLYRTTAAYLERRGLARPEVPWDEYAALQKG